MDLVEDHEAGQWTQRDFGFGETSKVCWSFQIEVVRWGPFSGDSMSDRGLAHRSGADERDDGCGVEALFEGEATVVCSSGSSQYVKYDRSTLAIHELLGWRLIGVPT